MKSLKQLIVSKIDLCGSSRNLKGVLAFGLLFSGNGAWGGTELGNARFLDYVNPLHGVSFQYPEEWNVVDLGDAVNVLAGQKESAGVRETFKEVYGSSEHVELVFSTQKPFLSSVAFEKWVKAQDPDKVWASESFLGKHALVARSSQMVVYYILKGRESVMRLRYPVDAESKLPSALVEKTVNTLSFFN